MQDDGDHLLNYIGKTPLPKQRPIHRFQGLGGGLIFLGNHHSPHLLGHRLHGHPALWLTLHQAQCPAEVAVTSGCLFNIKSRASSCEGI